MNVGARWAGLGIFLGFMISWDFHVQLSLEFTQNGVKTVKTSIEQQFCGKKHLVESAVRRE